jgi:hypothetical protein
MASCITQYEVLDLVSPVYLGNCDISIRGDDVGKRSSVTGPALQHHCGLCSLPRRSMMLWCIVAVNFDNSWPCCQADRQGLPLIQVVSAPHHRTWRGELDGQPRSRLPATPSYTSRTKLGRTLLCVHSMQRLFGCRLQRRRTTWILASGSATSSLSVRSA